MARLSSVIGGVLAELVRARSISDRLTKELVAEYQTDPVLASLSVPRITVRNAEIAVRYAVEDITDVAPKQPDVDGVLDVWRARIEPVVMSRILTRGALTSEEVKATLSALDAAGGKTARPTKTELRQALTGDAAPAARKVTSLAVANFAKVPADVRKKFTSKAAFQKALETVAKEEIEAFVRECKELEIVKAALATQLDVSVNPADLGKIPEQMQEIKLTINGEDLDLIFGPVEAAEDK